MTDTQLLAGLLICCLISFLLGRYLAFRAMQKKIKSLENRVKRGEAEREAVVEQVNKLRNLIS